MEYCLIEKWSDYYSLPKNCKALAISPKACYELDQAGVEYVIFNDLYCKDNIKNTDYDNHLRGQLLWFKEFDKLIKDTYLEAENLDIDLATLYYYNIKYLVDHLIYNCSTLNNFLDKEKPSKIWYIEDVNEEDKFDQWHWFTYGKNSYLLLIKFICNKRSIECEKLSFYKDKAINSNLNKFNSSLFFDTSKIKLLIKYYFPKLIQLLRNIRIRYYFWINTKNSHINYRTKRKLLIIKIYDYSIDFIRDASQNGYCINFLLNNAVNESSIIGSKKTIPFFTKDDIIKNNNERISKLLKNFTNSSLMNWINLKCGVDVSNILELRFEYLFKDIFPSTLGLIKGFIKHFDSNNIDYVFTNSLATTYDFAAVAAARLSKKTKSIGFFHGIDVVGLKERFFMEYNNFDLYFTSTSYELRYIKELKKEFNSLHPTLGTIPYYRNYFTNKSIVNFSSKKIKRKNVILFLPIVRKKRNSATYTRKHLTTMSAIRWHNALLEYFSTRSDFNFIWKDNAYFENFDDSIFKTINNNNYKNIFYENRKLEKVLPLVSKVICDLPSTGFFECIISGYPVITFGQIDNNNIQEEAFSFLGNSLKSFTTLDQKLKIVENFINDPPKDYIINLPKDNSSVIDILNNNIVES